MSDSSTRRMIEMYMEEASAPMFLSGFFHSPQRNFHTTEHVELDVIREDEEVAVAIQDLTVGPRENEATKYTNKAFTPPIFDEAGTITAFDMIKRMPGIDPFQDPNYLANASEEAFRIFRRLERKIRRAIELMASQVLQTGALTLIDSNGATLYSLNFMPKAAQMATVATAWALDGSTGNPLADLGALARVVRRNGKRGPNKLVFGSSAMQRFIANATVRSVLFTNQNSPTMGQLAPQTRGEGATFIGHAWIENYRFELWLYDGTYKHPQTGTITPFVSDDNVIMMSDGRLDLSFGAIPMIRRPEAQALAFLPPRMSDSNRGLDLTVNAWFTPDGKHLKVSAGTRPLTIPTAIDTFARLDVTP